MNLESKALPATCGDCHSENPYPEKATSFYGNENSSLDGTSSRGKRTATITIENKKSGKRKKPNENNAAVLYNIPPMSKRATVENFVEKMFSEMHGKTIKIVRSLCISKNAKVSEPLTFLVTFETPELADLAISLNGVRFFDHTIYASIYNPDWVSDKTNKLRLCFNYYCGVCKNKESKNCRHAHGVLDLNLYHKTVLNDNRTIYLCNVPFRYPREHLLSSVRKKFDQYGIAPFFTAFHVRGEKGDALLEFADVVHAKIAHDVLNGTRIATKQVKVHPWKPELQPAFVKYLMDEARTRSDGNRLHVWTPESLPKPTRRRKDANESFAKLEEENIGRKWWLDEAPNDVRYYRDEYGREISHAKDARRMEEKVDRLRRENDDLIRENDRLRRRYHDSSSRSSKSHREMNNVLEDELYNMKHRYEESQLQVYDLKCELDKTMEENEELVKVSNRLKNTVEHLESNTNIAKRESKETQRQEELQRRLDEALSSIERLSGVVTATEQQLRDVELENETVVAAMTNIQVENEALQEEMEQMRMNHAMELGFAGEA